MGWKDAPEVAAAPSWMSAPEVAEQSKRPRNFLQDVQDTISGALGFAGDLNRSVRQQAGSAAAGSVRGAGSIGATVVRPFETADENEQRRQAMTEALAGLGAEQDSPMFQIGKLGAEIAGTSGVGGVLANGVRTIPGAAKALPHLIESLRTGGMGTSGATGVYGTGVRVAGGAVNGAAQAGLVNPEAAQEGALIGAAMAPAVQVAGKAGQ